MTVITRRRRGELRQKRCSSSDKMPKHVNSMKILMKWKQTGRSYLQAKHFGCVVEAY